MNESQLILIAGIGNIFFGDDAFGCELAQRLSRAKWAPGVTVRDFGIRGIDLAYALMDPYKHVILLDAVMRGGKPGTLYFIRPDIGTSEVAPATPTSPLDAHSLDPEKALHLAASWGQRWLTWC